MKTPDEFAQSVKEAVIETAYYTYPKDYRKSLAYSELPSEQKFSQAISRMSMEDILDIIKSEYKSEYSEDAWW